MEEDKYLYKEFLKGNKDAFEKLILKYKNNIVYFITRYIKNMELSEDIFQDVVVYILENKEKYDFNYSFKTYMYMIAKSKSIDCVKHEKYTESIEEKDYIDEQLLEEIIFSKERKLKIQNVINKLPSNYQIVIYLTQIEGISYKETAKIIGKTEKQIKTLAYNARKKLRLLLIKEKVVEMEKKKILIIIPILLTVITPLIVIATKDLIMYDEQGRVIIHAGEEKPDIPEDTPTVFVVHKETESEKDEKKEQEHQNALAEKEAFEMKAQIGNETESEENVLTDEEKDEMDSVILAEHNYENEAKAVLKKYYGNSKIENLFKQLKSETNKSTGGSLISEYTIPECGIELINLMFNIIEGNEATISEKETVKKYLETIEPLGIRDDDELRSKLENLKE